MVTTKNEFRSREGVIDLYDEDLIAFIEVIGKDATGC